MIVKPGDVWVTEFATAAFNTGIATNASSASGTLVVNGVDNAAAVTVANITTGRYKASVTIPVSLVAGDTVAMAISATVSGVAGVSIIAHATVDTKRVGALNDIAAGALMGLTTNAITSGAIASGALDSVWSTATRTLSPAVSVSGEIFGTIVEGTFTFMDFVRIMAAALGGKISGAELNTPVFRNMSDGKNVITATTDDYGNRLTITLDPT